MQRTDRLQPVATFLGIPFAAPPVGQDYQKDDNDYDFDYDDCDYRDGDDDFPYKVTCGSCHP